MIEVITRLSQGVYLVGETLECSITFRSPSPPANAKSSWNEQEEILALASAQIYCQCRLSPSQIMTDDGFSSLQYQNGSTTSKGHSRTGSIVANSRTSFAPLLTSGSSAFSSNFTHDHDLPPLVGGGDGGGTGPGSVTSSGSARISSSANSTSNAITTTSTGTTASTIDGNSRIRIVASTKPTILFCDLRLLPGESKTFWYRETIPIEGPPSFRGQTVRYAYRLTIGTQRINSAMKLHNVIPRVLVLQEFTESTLMNCANEDLTPTNPFLSNETSQDTSSNMDSALQILQLVTSQRNQKFYNITNPRGHVVKFCIFKQGYKLGEDIVGSLDFSESTVPCSQYAVTLQSVEEILPEFRKSENQKPFVTSYTKFHEFVIGYQQTHFVLPIPLHITPSFHTDIINLKWKLHFEFVTCTDSFDQIKMKPQSPPSSSSSASVTKSSEDMNGQYWQCPSSMNIETMVWDLPIKIYPNLPSYLSQGLQIQTISKQYL